LIRTPLRCVVVAAIVLSACRSPSGVGTQLRTTVTRTGRYPVVHVTGEPPHWQLDSIATLTDSGGVGFRQIRSVLIDPRGGVLVMSAGPAAITRFDDHGVADGLVGRVGSGPQEYQAPVGGGWLDGDLTVDDNGNGRLIRWNAKGDFVAQWFTPHACCMATMVRQAGPSHVWLLNVARQPGTHGMSRGYIRFPSTGQLDTIWYGPAPANNAGVECPWGNGNIEIFSIPFATPAFSVEPAPDGTLYELSGLDYRIAMVSPGGDTVKVLSRDVPAAPIRDQEWQDSTREYVAFRASHGASSCSRAMQRPAAKALVEAARFDDRGRLWVERNVADGVRWEVWQQGALVGSAIGGRWNRNLPIDIRTNRIAIARSSDDGGSVVVLYRVSER
jgi:hypothetical protein